MPSFARLHITRDPLILGLTFTTRGPKRDYRLLRLHNGVSILVDPDTFEPFGWSEMKGMVTESVLRLPLEITLRFKDD